jgi:hypothetical protein
VPASAIYDMAGLLMIAPTATDPELTAHGYSRVFRATFTDGEVGRQMADHRHDIRIVGQSLRHQLTLVHGLVVVLPAEHYAMAEHPAVRVELRNGHVQPFAEANFTSRRPWPGDGHYDIAASPPTPHRPLDIGCRTSSTSGGGGDERNE